MWKLVFVALQRWINPHQSCFFVHNGKASSLGTLHGLETLQVISIYLSRFKLSYLNVRLTLPPNISIGEVRTRYLRYLR